MATTQTRSNAAASTFPAQSSAVQRAGQAQVVHDFVEDVLDIDTKADVVVLGLGVRPNTALAAAAFWEKQNPPKPAETSNFAPTAWGFGHKTEDKDLNLLFADEDAWADKEVRKVFSERNSN